MWEFIKHKLTKLGCFALIAIAMILVTALTKFILGWFNFDNLTKEKLSASAGEYFGMGILGLLLAIGFVSMVSQLRKELRDKQIKQPPGPPLLIAESYSPPTKSPPPLPSDRTATVQTGRTKKKGCITALVVVSILPLLAFAVIWYFASEYEKQPKKPGQVATDEADNFISAYKSTEASGNTPEAIELGVEFARNLRVSRGVLIADGKAGFGDMTHGRFLTYCFLTDESAALIVHVPGLRKFSDDAKLTLEETAWTIATNAIVSKRPQVKKIALGIKGDLDYSSIVTGIINQEEPLKGIETRHPTFPNKALWPYFIGPGKTAEGIIEAPMKNR